MLIYDVSSLHLKTINLPYITFKRIIESVFIVFKPKEEFTSRESNPGLLCESLITLQLGYQRYLEKLENFINNFDNFSWLLSPVSPVKIGKRKRTTNFNQSIKKLCLTGFCIIFYRAWYESRYQNLLYYTTLICLIP